MEIKTNILGATITTKIKVVELDARGRCNKTNRIVRTSAIIDAQIDSFSRICSNELRRERMRAKNAAKYAKRK